MTIKKARKILGKLAKGKSDEEVQDMIDRVSGLVGLALDAFYRLSPEERKKFAKPAGRKLTNKRVSV